MAWFLLTDAATLITGGSLENGKGGGNERMGSHCRDQMMVQKRSPLIRGRDVNEETLAPHGVARTRCANDPTRFRQRWKPHSILKFCGVTPKKG